MKPNLEENHHQLVATKKVCKESHQHVLLLDLNYSSNLLSSKIADIPQKLKYETVLAPIFEYCFGTSDQDLVWEKLVWGEPTKLEMYTSDDHEIIKLKIDWIRDETFIYSQMLYLHEEKLNIMARKLGLWNNRKFILNSCCAITNALKYANEELKNDKEFVKKLLLHERGGNFEYVSDKLRNDEEIVKLAVKINGIVFEHAPKFKDDKEILLLAVESWPYAYDHASERLQNDRDVVLKTVSIISEKFNYDRELSVKLRGLKTLRLACSKLKNDKEVVLQAIKIEDRAFGLVSDELKKEREFVKEVVTINGGCLRYVSKEFRNDKEIAELALKSYPDAIHHLSDRLRFKDNEFISKAIGKRGFHQLPNEFSNDREIALESIKLNIHNFERSSKKLHYDREFILQAVKNCGMVFNYLNEELKSDREIILEAVKQNGDVLSYIPVQYFDDEEIILKAAQPATELTYSNYYNKLSDRLKNDREFLMQLGGFFTYFPIRYKLDREIVMECLKTHPDLVLRNAYTLIATDRVLAMKIVKRNGLLLGEMPFKYRNDRELVSFAIRQNTEAFKFVSDQ